MRLAFCVDISFKTSITSYQQETPQQTSPSIHHTNMIFVWCINPRPKNATCLTYYRNNLATICLYVLKSDEVRHTQASDIAQHSTGMPPTISIYSANLYFPLLCEEFYDKIKPQQYIFVAHDIFNGGGIRTDRHKNHQTFHFMNETDHGVT